VEGDRKYLGWLTNQGSATQLLAGRFDSIDKFEKRYRQPNLQKPNVLDRLLETGDPKVALAVAPPIDPADASPTNSGLTRNDLVPISGGPTPKLGAPIIARNGRVALQYIVKAAAGAARITGGTIEVNGKRVAPLVVGRDGSTAGGPVDVPIPDGSESVVSLVVEDAKGVRRSVHVPVINPNPFPPARRRSRLEILSIGSETFANKRLPTIQHARNDALALAEFLRDRMIDPATGTRFAPGRTHIRTFVEPREIAAGPLTRALDALRNAEGDEKLVENDAVAVVLESHFFSHNAQPLIATAEPGDALVPGSISAADLAERLGELAGRGCRVVVLLDVIHELDASAWGNDLEFKDWIRQLQLRRNVATFVASAYGPSLPLNGKNPDPGRYRAFAEGVQNSIRASGSSGVRKPAGAMTFFEFDQSVRHSVLENTRQKQRTGGYLPETMRDLPFLDTTESGYRTEKNVPYR
jgi:hypothetical protein